MSKKAGELEAGALNAWTPVQQAALYQQYLVEQHEKDQLTKLKEFQEEEKKQSDKEKGIEEDVPPEQVSAGKVIDDLIKNWCGPLYDFLDVFASPHISLVPFILLHLLFWWAAPWYFHFSLPYPLLYGIPVYMTLKSIWSKNDRPAWQAWWVELALVEYLELVLFRENARSLIWWPKIKAALFFVLYCTVDTEEGERDRKTGKKPKLPIFRSILIIKRWLPKLPKDEKEEAKEKEKKKKEEEEKAKEKEKEKAKAKEDEKKKAKAKGK